MPPPLAARLGGSIGRAPGAVAATAAEADEAAGACCGGGNDGGALDSIKPASKRKREGSPTSPVWSRREKLSTSSSLARVIAT
mmetsp:Transcript_113387/g.353491  ORF Transcript_113387/g.353491 Transcript_113387/m.353491 type:complete len:83 (+) Transcript_113387:120-368(+)